MTIRSFFLLVAYFSAMVGAVVPQVKLCDAPNCPSVSRMGAGTLHLGDQISGLQTVDEVQAWIEKAYSLGITLFDLADVYPVKGGDSGTSAELFGAALAKTGLRDKVFIVGKMGIVFPSAVDTSRAHLQSTLDWYLKVLNTDHIDLLLIHYSNAFMNASEVAEFFVDMKNDGKVHHFGVSNHFPSKFNLLQKALDSSNSGIQLITHEFEASVWNPSYLNYDSALADHSYEKGLRPLAWCPLGGDPLGGLNRLFVRSGQRQTTILRALSDVSSEMGISDDSVTALVWLLSHPLGFIPLLGTTNVDRLQLQTSAMDYVGLMTNEQWWAIAGKAGICAYGDSQCNYEDYKASA